MEWTVEDNMVDSLFFCTTLTGHRGGHTPFVQAGVETSNTGAEAVKPDPGSLWEGHSTGIGAGVEDENVESCGAMHLLRIPLVIHPLRHMLLLSDKLMRCCAAGTNECLDLRRRVFALNGWVSA